MKRVTAILFFLTLAAVGRSDPGFWQQMTPEERRAAGVDQLTPEQQAVLDAQAARFAKEGARQAVEVVRAENSEALRRIREQAKAEAKEEAKVEAHKQKVADAGLAARDSDETIRTRIVGDFRGWTGNTTFTLENDQVWQQTERDNRFFPKMVNPEVELIPSKWSGWKLQLVSEGLWIRVKRIH